MATSNMAALPPETVSLIPWHVSAWKRACSVPPEADSDCPIVGDDELLLLLFCDARRLIPKKQSIIHMTSSMENMHAMSAPFTMLGMPPGSISNNFAIVYFQHFQIINVISIPQKESHKGFIQNFQNTQHHSTTAHSTLHYSPQLS